MDKFFRVETISKTHNPQQVIYAAMHQDYSEDFVFDSKDKWPFEAKCGELIVKNLLAGNRGHYGCYSADTEVLTDTGWVRWDNVTPDAKLLAVDINSGFCSFEIPSDLHVFDVIEGDKLYSVQSQFLNMLVTLDHRMVISTRCKNGSFSDWGFKTAEEVIGKPVRYLLNSCLKDEDRDLPELPKGVDSILALKLAGFFFGDGLRSYSIEPGVIRFRLRRPRKIAYLMGLGLDVTPRKGDRYTVQNKELATWIHQNFSTPLGKVLPPWLLKLPRILIAAFWDGLKNSDGTRIKEKSWSYDSCEKAAIDMIQATAHINGFSATITLNSPNLNNLNHRPCWRVTISENSTRRSESCQKGRNPGVVESLVEYTGKVYCATVSTGALLVRRDNKVVVSGNCLEHPQIILNIGWFPHSTMQQIRTHRIGISVDCQSFRYTGKRIVDVANGARNVEEVFYLRPIGFYSDRQGKKYEYTAQQRNDDLVWCLEACQLYKNRIDEGFSEEHARGLIPFDVRQNWVMSVNVRSLMHLLDLRWKKDAQLEAQQLCTLIWPHFDSWVPAIADWYKQNRASTARLAP